MKGRAMKANSKSLFRTLRLARTGIAGLVFILFYLSISFTGPLYKNILDTLTSLQFLPSFINVAVAGGAWIGAGFFPVLLLTLLLGRVYCSTLCPLGILQDVVLFLSRRIARRTMRYRNGGWNIHVSVTLLTFSLAAAGIPVLLGLLEPFAFWGRTYRDVIVPLGRLISTGLVEAMKSFRIYLSPVPFEGEPGAVFMTVILLAALVLLTVRYGRWYCNRLCPAGCVLRAVSIRPAWSIRFVPDKCTSCGSCASICRSGCIDIEAQTVFSDRCVVCFDCLSACPFGALEIGGNYRKSKNRISKKQPADPNRRKAVVAAAGALLAAAGVTAGAGVLGQSYGTAKKADRTVIPPGSGSLYRYTSRCISCHTCVSVCPTHVLQPSFFALGVSGFLQPVMDYRSGYCEWECNVCTQVCPTGALSPITVKNKQALQLGRVEFVEDRCVVFSQGTACGACAEVCPTQAVRMVPFRGDLTQPFTDNAICSGCGSCEYACPVDGEKAIFVRGLDSHQAREVRETEQSPFSVDVPEEFPF